MCGAHDLSSYVSITNDLFDFLVQTGTVATDSDEPKILCDACESSVKLIEQARHARAVLAAKFKNRFV